MRRHRTFTSLACAAVTALTIGATAASADPSPSNPNVLTFNVVCPGIAPFQAAVVGPIGFVDGQRLLALRGATATQGSLEFVECTATNPQIGTQTVFLHFVERG